MCASQKPLNNSHNIVKRPFLHLPSTGDQAVLHDIIKTGKIEMNRLKKNPLFWEVNGIYFQIKYMCSRLNHEYSLSMLCSSSGKVAAGTGGEEEVDGVSLCVFVVFHIREISQEEIRI